jgi:assimilatory nitrate reductase catalytic subunit
VSETRSTCPYCGVGCGVIVETKSGAVTGVRGDPDHPANLGRLCNKGSTLHLTATAAVRRHDRLLTPMWRARRGAPAEPLGWDDTLDRLAARFATTVAAHGPDAVAFYVSGQLLTEDYYVFNKLAKGLIGTNNIDSNSRLCMSSAVAGYKQSLGADAPPTCYDDVAHAGCLFVAGSNAAWTHPVLFRRVEDARAARPELKMIVVDPRRTETAAAADLHLQIQPGSDVALLHGMLHALIWEDRIDRGFIDAHTVGFAAVKALVADMPPREAARICGIPVGSLLQATRWFADAPATLSLWCQGLNQSTSGTAKNTALINLHLATAQIGRPGAGPFSLTGQPNAMGGREVGGMANLLSAHRDLADPAHRAEVARLWGVPSVPERRGKTAVELFEAAERGEIKALWIVCTNPAQSMPDQAMVRRALERCELVVLQEAFAHTETARFADVLLPASTWPEKDGTVTNSERCISRVRATIAPPGEARADSAIAVGFARRLQALLRPDLPDLFGDGSVEAIWNEHRESTRGRDLDITGLSYALLERLGPQQWPCPERTTEDRGAAPDAIGATAAQGAEASQGGTGTCARLGTARLYTDHVFATADGRARFVASPYRPPAEARSARHPFALNTGRLRDQWHGMSRSGTVARLFGHEGGPAVRMNPHDLPRRALAEGDLVEIESRRGTIVLPLVADPDVGRGEAYAAMHWGEEFVSGTSAAGVRRAGVNALTTRAACADSFQPELKHAAVRIARAELPWRLSGAAWIDAGERSAIEHELRACMAEFGYASCVPVAGADGRSGLAFEAAAASAIDPARVDAIAALFGLTGASVLRYLDDVRGRRRLLAIEGSGDAARLAGLLLVGETPLAGWLRTLWQEQRAVAPFRRALLAPGAAAPSGVAAPRHQVCNCFDVAEATIRAALAGINGPPADRIRALQESLRCGTNCGSCLPELRRIAQAVPFAATPAAADAALPA